MKWTKKSSSPSNEIYGIFGKSNFFNVYLHRNRAKNYYWWQFSELPENSKEEVRIAEGRIYKDDSLDNFELCQKIVERISDIYEIDCKTCNQPHEKNYGKNNEWCENCVPY